MSVRCLAMDWHPIQTVLLPCAPREAPDHHDPNQDNVVTHKNNVLLSSYCLSFSSEMFMDGSNGSNFCCLQYNKCFFIRLKLYTAPAITPHIKVL